ncbi:MAG: hypothetical protein AAFO69_13045 [Bacteroidota bacterium]
MEENDYRDYYALAKRLIEVEKKTEAEAATILVGEGVDREKAEKLVAFASGRENGNEATGMYADEEDAGRSGAIKDIVIGGIFCVGGTIATLAEIGYIFWGAILFGGIQLIRGLIKLGSSK